MSEQRDLRDILGEMMRRERLGTVARPAWADWYDDAREYYRRNADNLIRLLATEGVTLARIGEEALKLPAPTSPVFWRDQPSTAAPARLLRFTDDKLEVVREESGSEKVLLAFTIWEAHRLASRVLIGDRSAAEQPGALTTLAASLEAYRLDAAVMGEP